MMLSVSEKDFVFTGIKNNVRSDARTRFEQRQVEIQHDILPATNGSAKVTLLGEGTCVLAAVKLQIMDTSVLNLSNANDAERNAEHGNEYDEDADADEDSSNSKNKLKCFVDIWGKARTQWRQYDKDTLKTQISQLLNCLLNESGVLDSQRLTIIPGKLLWKIQMDISIEQVGGGLIDLCMLAARTALWDTRIPKLHIETLSDGVFEYSIDEHLEEQSMIIESIPLSVTLHKFDKYFCADCSLEEEECSEGFVTVAVDSNGSIYAVKKGGDKGIQPAIMTEMIQAAKKIAQEKVMSHDLFLENCVRAL